MLIQLIQIWICALKRRRRTNEVSSTVAQLGSFQAIKDQHGTYKHSALGNKRKACVVYVWWANDCERPQTTLLATRSTLVCRCCLSPVPRRSEWPSRPPPARLSGLFSAENRHNTRQLWRRFSLEPEISRVKRLTLYSKFYYSPCRWWWLYPKFTCIWEFYYGRISMKIKRNCS